MDDVAIRVEGLGKRFRLRHTSSGPHYRTLREDLLGLPRRLFAGLCGQRDGREEFWALKGVSFEVKRGEVLGIIGRNGAGKSTLLKVLSRIIDPTCGEANVQGRIGSLLEVGTGFHPELTGRENIFLSGALLGMRRDEVRRRFDEIVAFAGVEKFIDTVCKHYSSGMYARLGFAVAAHLDAEILLVDEVLAVGDAEFRDRCQAKMRNVVESRGRSVVVVSHDPALVRSLCDRAVWLDGGRVRTIGSASEALHAYYESRLSETGRITDAIERIAPGFVIERVTLNGSESRRVLIARDQRVIEIEVVGTLSGCFRVALEVRLYDSSGAVLAFFSPGHDSGRVCDYGAGPFRLFYKMRLPRLLRGDFALALELTDPNIQGWVTFGQSIHLEVEGTNVGSGILVAGAHCGWQMLDCAEDSERNEVQRSDLDPGSLNSIDALDTGHGGLQS